ncbi:differentially expressed in FDCP 6-like [Frankliniella occidentalis]|uniref:Differentially expressed in FDCP 6-like n=1 Tax=Frankliniella occidentalis TaxID=133901 RepID=A0A6J1RSJ1_FRAOC|nr:differentially expressed in FDCP 6-like [Frankliniella occidentalis]XP_026271374.1 differentially expressed in FDCP 6-like [Frankliniella occidentalis]
MSLLLKNATNSIWHAFNALCCDKSGLVVKSKLKVLTANIGTLLDLYGVEKGLEHYRSTSDLNFEHFKYYLQKEVFSSLPDNFTLTSIQDFEARVDEVCWLVCKKDLILREKPLLPDDSVFQLFRVFCMLADLIESSEIYQVLMHSSEVGKVVSEIVYSVGLEWDAGEFEILSSSVRAFRFSTFLALIETKYFGDGCVEIDGLVEAVQEIFRTYLQDVLKKGTLMKRGFLLPTLREYWFVLRPTQLNYYKSQDERECCGSISLDTQCRVDATSRGMRTQDKAHRLALHTSERTYEFAAYDHRSRLQWISSLHLAIAQSGCREGYQRTLAARRRAQREADAFRLSEEHKRRTSQILDMELTRAQLQAEKVARVAAELQAKELEAVHREEGKRVQMLEETRRTLERLLEEETQAKRDEEIVRNLQGRVLREEMEHREKLERLQEEQKALLELEREKRMEFEKQQKDKEEQLSEAQQRLRQLEDEKQKLDKELESAQEKITSSEKSKEVLEAKLRVMLPQLKDSGRICRALSFVPSTKERPAFAEVRSNISANGLKRSEEAPH